MNVMIDVETMGVRSNAAIIAIGAVKFDKSSISPDTFYRVIDLQSCMDAGLTVDASTILWWMKQSKEAREEFTSNLVPVYSLTMVLQEFMSWLSFFGDIEAIWGNGGNFDNVILASACQAVGIEPWDFWQDRCYRTAKSCYPELDYKFEGTPHNALDDATSQAKHLIKLWSLNEH